jgi:hypothetical protein
MTTLKEEDKPTAPEQDASILLARDEPLPPQEKKSSQSEKSQPPLPKVDSQQPIIDATIERLISKVPPEVILNYEYLVLLQSGISPSDYTGPIQVDSVDYDGLGQFLATEEEYIKDFIRRQASELSKRDMRNELPPQSAEYYQEIARNLWNTSHIFLVDFLTKNNEKLRLFFSGSNRQDNDTESRNQSSGLSIKQYQQFCALQKIIFCRFLLADVDNWTIPGTASENLSLKYVKGAHLPWIKELQQEIDEEQDEDLIKKLSNIELYINDFSTKIRLIAYQMQYVAMMYPASSGVTYKFSDDRMDIVTAVKRYFEAYRALLPPNFTLELYHADCEEEGVITQVPFTPLVHDEKSRNNDSSPLKVSVVLDKKEDSGSSPAFSIIPSPPPSNEGSGIDTQLSVINDYLKIYLKFPPEQIKHIRHLLQEYQQQHPLLKAFSTSDANALIHIHKVLKAGIQFSEITLAPGITGVNVMGHRDEEVLFLIEKYVALCLNNLVWWQQALRDINKDLIGTSTTNLENIDSLCNELLDSSKGLFFSSLAEETESHSDLSRSLDKLSPSPAVIIEKLSKLQKNFTNLAYWMKQGNLESVDKVVSADLEQVLSSLQRDVNDLSSKMSPLPSDAKSSLLTDAKSSKKYPLLEAINESLEIFNSTYRGYQEAFGKLSPDAKEVKSNRYQITLEVRYVEFLSRCKAAGFIPQIELPENPNKAQKFADSLIEKLKMLEKEGTILPKKLKENILTASQRLYILKTQGGFINHAAFFPEGRPSVSIKPGISGPPPTPTQKISGLGSTMG